MDSETKAEVKKTVLEILEDANMAEMTEYKVRQLAGKELGINLSEPQYKSFVRKVIETFLNSREQQQEAPPEEAAAAPPPKEKEEEEQDDEEEERPVKQRKKKEGTVKKFKQEALQQTEEDDNGDLIICQLSNRRNVTVQDWRGKKLISIREYYEKDGKLLPSSKGISLTIDQWEAFKKGVPAIEEAIEQLQ